MSYLLYCILAKPPVMPVPSNLPGIEGEPVTLIAEKGLSAAVSKISGASLAPELGKLLAYGKVVESWHRRHTVIPMRFGCLVENRPQLAELLQRNSRKYQRLLQELDGCAEMGIRFLPLAEPSGNSPANPAGPNPSAPSGRAYLAHQKLHYDAVDRSTQNLAAVIQSCRKAFAGLYRQCRTENRSSLAPPLTMRAPLLSLNFLVSKNCVKPFRQVFRENCAPSSGELLLTGPWPPYNFAMLEETAQDPNLLGNQS